MKPALITAACWILAFAALRWAEGQAQTTPPPLAPTPTCEDEVNPCDTTSQLERIRIRDAARPTINENHL